MNKVETYWENFIEKNPEYHDRKYTAWHFCDNKEDADHLAVLVINGTKQATASLEKIYDFDPDPRPEVGDISLIINWEKEPKCIIETTKIHKYIFRDVPAGFAAIEGEGDKSLAYWKEVHAEAFSRDADEYGFEFNEDLIDICEEFKVIYKGL
ncbi:MAG: ASCH domain-containing protein [Spirochaetaceae bacterium]|jgi:uncharacterized protein YhfF|nr:ASCH domain-containing protein [Spirochaetaceae bacterium]